MTFEQVLTWCRDNGADARGIYRARDFFIRRSDDGLPDNLPPIGALFHWDVRLNEAQLAVSPSDMERMVSGKCPWKNSKPLTVAVDSMSIT